jgi:hypothetical protein
VDETKEQARVRLHRRTLQLQAEHEALEQFGRRFDKAEHERHREALRAHHHDLEAYRNMPNDPD